MDWGQHLHEHLHNGSTKRAIDVGVKVQFRPCLRGLAVVTLSDRHAVTHIGAIAVGFDLRIYTALGWGGRPPYKLLRETEH